MISVTHNITILKSAWWLLMAWGLFDDRASATIAMAYHGRCDINRYILPVSDSFRQLKIMMIMTHEYDNITGIMIYY